MSAAGDLVARIAESWVGCCGCEDHRATMAIALGVDPERFDWRPFAIVKGRVQGVSTCAMIAGHALAVADVSHTFFPWKLGTPLGAFQKLGESFRRWRKPAKGLFPERGDVLLLGKDGGTHVCIVSHCDGKVLETVDGGQTCVLKIDGHEGIGRQCVKAATRAWQGSQVIGVYGPVPVVGWISLADFN